VECFVHWWHSRANPYVVSVPQEMFQSLPPHQAVPNPSDDVMVPYAALLKADDREYYDYLVKEGELFHALAWSYPEIGATFIPPKDWTDPCRASMAELGGVINTLLYLEDGRIYEPKVREVCRLPMEQEGFDKYLIGIAEGLLSFRESLLALPVLQDTDLPDSLEGRIKGGLLPLLDRSLNRVVCKVENWELMDEAFLDNLDNVQSAKLTGVKYPLALSYTLSTYSRKTSSPFTPYDPVEIAKAFGQFVSSDTKPSLLWSRKVKNVEEAERHAQGLERLSIREILDTNVLILTGVSDGIAGTLRRYDCTVGDGRVCAPPAEIPNLLDGWIEAANAVSDVGEVEDRYKQIAELATIYQYIHATSDGNGRTGHIVTNWCLRKAGLPGFSVPKKHEAEYIQAYDQASLKGDYTPLIELFKKFAVVN